MHEHTDTNAEIWRSEEIVGHWVTEAEASDWIAHDKRLGDAADPFRTQAAGRWRGG